MPPPTSMMNPEQVVFRHGSHIHLPIELADSLNQVYFLHLLATEPGKVIPPGKTLLSMMIHSQMNAEKIRDSQAENLLEKVQEVAHRAFWSEAIEAISSPLPSVQLPRLKRLYHDLADALAPLFPHDHKVLQALQAQLPPTSSPLHSALHFLEEILSALRERCAPIRDQAVDSLYARLDAWRDPKVANGNPETPTDTSSSPLAVLIVNTIREIVTLGDQMKADLNAAVIGAMGEHEVRAFVLREAKAKERDLVSKLWGPHQPPFGQHLREEWRSWVESAPHPTEGKFGDVPSERKWVVRLMEQLAMNQAVTCHLPSLVDAGETSNARAPNGLPLHFLFVIPKLVYVQNYLQAITIAASLRSLTHIPVTKSTSHDFMIRVWALLKGEVDDDIDGKANDLGPIKVINLSDEVIRARRSLSPDERLDPEVESRLRAAVERTLKPDDPVFMLLHRRLADALTGHVLESLSGDNVRNTDGNVPLSMRTGRDLSEPGKRPRIKSPDHTANPSTTNRIRLDGATAPVTVAVKGFEEPILANAVGAVYEEIIGCISWLEAVWEGDLVE